MGKVISTINVLVEYDDGSTISLNGAESIAQSVAQIEDITGKALPVDPTWQRLVDSETAATNIPGWASWTEQQAIDWIVANVTDLNSAKTALTAMARMIVALRNKTWPNLEGS